MVLSRWVSRSGKTLGVVGPLAAAACLFAGEAAFAQNGNKYDQQTIDLLNQPQDFSGQGRAYGSSATSAFPNPSSIDLAKLTRTLNDYSRMSSDLYVALDTQVNRVPAVRSLLTDMIKIRARASLLSQQIRANSDISVYGRDLQGLDSDWRLLSYKLNSARGLDRNTMTLIQQIDTTNDSLSKLMQGGPSVSYRDLIQQTNALVSNLDRLLQDIDWELQRTPQAQSLILEGQKVRQQAAHVSEYAFQQTEYNHLVSDFKLFQQVWTNYSSKLRVLNNRIIERDMQQISENDRNITALLYIPATINREQLLQLTRNLQRDVTDFFDRAPLVMLIKLPNPELALPSADEFYGVFENFIDVVNRGENLDSLVDAFRYIQGSWSNFARVYRPLKSTDAQQVLNAIERDVQTLSGALLIQEGFDRSKASELAATIVNLAEHIQRDTDSWLNKERPNFSSDARRETLAFVQNAHELHEALAGNVNMREARQMSDALFESWRRVYSYIIQCRSSERSFLAANSSQTTPAIVELRTILSK